MVARAERRECNRELSPTAMRALRSSNAAVDGFLRLGDRQQTPPAGQSLALASSGATKTLPIKRDEQFQHFAARDSVAPHDADHDRIVEHIEQRQFAIDERRIWPRLAGST